MFESGEPGNTLQKMGIHRAELEKAIGKTVLIYEGEKLTIILPDKVDFTSKDIVAKVRDVTIEARNIKIKCNTLKVEGDVTIVGNLTVTGGVVNLN